MENRFFKYLVVLLSNNEKWKERFLSTKIFRIQDLAPTESSTH
jgi:hypothetical protein